MEISLILQSETKSFPFCPHKKNKNLYLNPFFFSWGLTEKNKDQKFPLQITFNTL